MPDFIEDPAVVDPIERRERGKTIYEIVTGKPASPPRTRREETLLDFVFGEVWARADLGVFGLRDRRLLVLSTLAAMCSYDDLERHLYGAIKADAFTIGELDEWVMQVAVYIGWAPAEKADRILQEQWDLVHEERGVRAPERPSYEPASTMEDQNERKAFGEFHYRDVNWTGSPPRTLPFFKDGILNFVFGRMWSHPGLNRRDRRIITIACVAVDDSVTPVHSHVFGALRSSDLSQAELDECVLQFGTYGGWPKASFLLGAVAGEAAKIAGSLYVPDDTYVPPTAGNLR